MKMYHVSENDGIILRDYLARDRTMLANERTLLAYIRTALGLFSAGAAGVKFVSDWGLIYYVGLIMMVVSPVVAVAGAVRFLRVQQRLRSIPDNKLLIDDEAL